MAREYRSRSRILLDLLRAVKRDPGIGVSGLMSRVNVSSERLDGYLEEVVGRGLVQVRPGARRAFELTDAGQRVLTELNRLERFMADFGMAL